MKKLLSTTLLVSLFSLSTSVFAQEARQASPKDDYLFVQMAPTATLQQQQKNIYILKLSQANPYVKYFTNRPARVTGTMPISKFLTEWHENFSKDTPNAGIYGMQNQKPVSVMMELSNPVYNAKSKTISYTARPLANEKSLPKQIRLRDVAVFIDDFCVSCSGSGF